MTPRKETEPTHEHDFCIPQWRPMPGTDVGFEQQNFCYDYKCECGKLRFGENK